MNSYPAWFRNWSDVKESQKLDFFVRYIFILVICLIIKKYSLYCKNASFLALSKILKIEGFLYRWP